MDKGEGVGVGAGEGGGLGLGRLFQGGVFGLTRLERHQHYDKSTHLRLQNLLDDIRGKTLEVL